MTDQELFEKLWAEMVEQPPGIKFEDGKWQIKASRQELFAMFSQARNQALEDAAKAGYDAAFEHANENDHVVSCPAVGTAVMVAIRQLKCH